MNVAFQELLSYFCFKTFHVPTNAYSDTLVRISPVPKSGLHKNINRKLRDREYREIERQRDRETERQRDRETERQRDRETERQRDRETEGQRDRES